MNSGMKMVFQKVNKRIPKGNHTLKPHVLQGPNAHLGMKNVNMNRRTNPKDQADMVRKSFSKSLAETREVDGGNTLIAQTSHLEGQVGTTQTRKRRKKMPIEVAHLRLP